MRTILLLIVSTYIFSCSGKIVPSNSGYNSHYIVEKDYKFHFISKGNKKKPPLLLIHGAPGNFHAYDNLLNDEKLLKNFHIIAVDRPGFGESITKNASPITNIKTQALIVAKALKINESKKKAVIVGRSYGGPIAAEIAALYPKKVRKIVLVSPVIDPENEKIFWFAHLGDHWLINALLPYEWRSATTEKFSHQNELKIIRPHWKKITSKASVIMGGKDKLASKHNFDFAKRSLKKKNSHYVFLPEAGHMITETHPELVKTEIMGL